MFSGSTDPGVYYTKHLINDSIGGVAHLGVGHHPSAWVVGLHRGKYEALVQWGNKVRIWRDLDNDFFCLPYFTLLITVTKAIMYDTRTVKIATYQ